MPTIVERYVSAAKRHGAASLSGDHIAANKAYDLLMSALKDLRKSSDKGADALRTLINDTDPFVVCSAATHLLPLDEAHAKEALRLLAASSGRLVALDSKMVLQEWEAGHLRIE